MIRLSVCSLGRPRRGPKHGPHSQDHTRISEVTEVRLMVGRLARCGPLARHVVHRWYGAVNERIYTARPLSTFFLHAHLVRWLVGRLYIAVTWPGVSVHLELATGGRAKTVKRSVSAIFGEFALTATATQCTRPESWACIFDRG